MSLTSVKRILGKQLKSQFENLHRTFAVQKFNILQEMALDNEHCILVDDNDNAIGSASKRDCHRVGADDSLLLHRAFSVFLFNSNGDFLMQRRSDSKVTYPGYFSNTCCSHPLWIAKNEENIIDAAIRRVNYELGIPLKQLDRSDFKRISRLHYKHTGDGKWGEYEITSILFVQKDIDVKPNPEEISEVRYIRKDGFKKTIQNLPGRLTPWCELIINNYLGNWWDNLHQLDRIQNYQTIHRI